MDYEIFTDWFHQHFLPDVKKHLQDQGLPVKTLLLLDNAPAHPEAGSQESDDGCIKAMFLPPSTTALIQPMDQGVLEALKRRYRRRLLYNLLLEDKDGQSIVEYAKSINLKDVLYYGGQCMGGYPCINAQKILYRILERKTKMEVPLIHVQWQPHKLCLGTWMLLLRMIMQYARRCFIL